MGLQKQVNLYRATGVQGDKATPNQSIYFPKQMVAEGDVTVGTFVFYGTDASTQASGSKPDGTASDIIGFVERVVNYANYDATSEGTLVVHDKSALTIAVCGDYWTVAAKAATPRQSVFVHLTTGAIYTDAPDAAIEGAVKTSWTVVQGGEAGSPILISNWTNANTGA